MGPVTVSPPPEPSDLALRWSGRISLTPRILAVNILALALLAGSLFYLDGYRSRLIEERIERARRETLLVASALAVAPRANRAALVTEYGRITDARLRVYNIKDQKTADSWPDSHDNFDLRDVTYPVWQQYGARWLDIGIDFVVGATIPPAFTGFTTVADNGAQLALAADRTHVISTNAQLPGRSGDRLFSDRNARDIRNIVRAERATLAIAIGIAVLFSIFISLFLARTIVRPLRQLAVAAVRVRLGRSRDVIIPRLPSRRDEIGMLARAISDMSNALRLRIDATDAFAADVAHELKNPLASLRSAVDSLQSVKDPALQSQLLGIVGDDVRRLDRLITDISELSRIESRLSRTRFEPVDMAKLVSDVIGLRASRQTEGQHVEQLMIANSAEQMRVRGDAAQLARVLENILDNAASFSPPHGIIAVSLQRDDDFISVIVDDQGPGIAAELRDAIFERFHSDRPEGEAFGKHSGLGLAIARTIISAHGGEIIAVERPSTVNGTRFIFTVPTERSE